MSRRVGSAAAATANIRPSGTRIANFIACCCPGCTDQKLVAIAQDVKSSSSQMGMAAFSKTWTTRDGRSASTAATHRSNGMPFAPPADTAGSNEKSSNAAIALGIACTLTLRIGPRSVTLPSP